MDEGTGLDPEQQGRGRSGGDHEPVPGLGGLACAGYEPAKRQGLGGQVRRRRSGRDHGPVIDTTRSFSFAAWVRADVVGGVVMAQVGTNKSPFELQYHPAKQRWCWVSYASDTVNALATPSPACGTEPVQPGVWVHLAGVYDAGSTNQLSLYVNGVRKGVGMANASVWSASGPLTIGAARNGAPTGCGSTAPSARPGSGTGSSTRRRTCPRSWRPVPVGQWDMDSDDQDEPRESGDSSDYRTPLTLGPAPAANWTTEGFNGSTALRFDGISGAAQTSGPVLRTDQSYTVSAWVRFAGGAGARTVIAQDGVNISSSFLELSCRRERVEVVDHAPLRRLDLRAWVLRDRQHLPRQPVDAPHGRAGCHEPDDEPLRGRQFVQSAHPHLQPVAPNRRGWRSAEAGGGRPPTTSTVTSTVSRYGRAR